MKLTMLQDLPTANYPVLAGAVPVYSVFCTSEGCKSNRTNKYSIQFCSILVPSVVLSLMEAVAVNPGAF